jgi:hypothetical protein
LLPLAAIFIFSLVKISLEYSMRLLLLQPLVLVFISKDSLSIIGKPRIFMQGFCYCDSASINQYYRVGIAV